MKLIIGLGNPEPRYDHTVHNVGFLMIDHYAAQKGCTWKHSEKFRANIAETTVAREKLLLIKPTTYYNLTGESARLVMDYYKLTPADILVMHDDLDLPLGTIRTRLGGSDGGNNGLKSLIAHLGADFHRLRIGTWVDRHSQTDRLAVVLGTLTKAEHAIMVSQQPTVAAIIESFASKTFTTTTYRVEQS